jgi:NIPSNAP
MLQGVIQKLKTKEEKPMLFELRQYRIKDGKRDQWVKLMEEQIIPFQTSKGVVVVGSFIAPEEDDLYVWIRRFENEAERKRLYKEIYESDFWVNEIKPQSGEMLDRESIINTLLEATPKSVLR